MCSFLHFSYTESSNSLTSVASNASVEENYEIQTFSCPLCSNTYDKLNELESHVQSCLEKNDLLNHENIII